MSRAPPRARTGGARWATGAAFVAGLLLACVPGCAARRVSPPQIAGTYIWSFATGISVHLELREDGAYALQSYLSDIAPARHREGRWSLPAETIRFEPAAESAMGTITELRVVWQAGVPYLARAEDVVDGAVPAASLLRRYGR